MAEVFRATISKEELLRLAKETAPKPPHPLTIPGELLAEAREFGRPVLTSSDTGWSALIIEDYVTGYEGSGSTPSEAISAAIAKARKMGEVK